MSAVITRLATENDIAAVAALFDAYRQFYEQRPDLRLATDFIGERVRKNESVIIVAQDAERILGFCQLYPSFCSVEAKPIYVLYDLFVAREARQRGVGQALLLAAERHAKHGGFSRMDLTTAKTNAVAQSLYESLGWTRDDIFYAYSRSIPS